MGVQHPATPCRASSDDRVAGLLLYGGVYLSDADHRALLRHLAGRYHVYVSYQESRDGPVRIAA